MPKERQQYKFANPDKIAVKILGNLAPLLAGHIPIDRALGIVAMQARSKKEREAAQSLETALRQGKKLSSALAEKIDFYGSTAVAAARAGESSGKLSEALAQYSKYLHDQTKLRRKLGNALVYPAVVLTVASVAIGLLLGLVVPRMTALLETLSSTRAGSPMPWSTQLLLSLSEIIRSPALLWILAVFIITLLLLLRRGKSGASPLARLITVMPVMGKTVQLGALARACTCISTLLRAGIPLAEALELAGPASGNAALLARIQAMTKSLRRGTPLSRLLMQTRWHGAYLASEAAALGEETGALDEQMEWVGKELEARTEARTTALLRLLEPALIILMALIVGLVAIALFMPVLALSENAAGF